MTTLPSANAYSFLSDLSLDEMYAVLNERSGLEWLGGDNDFWGEYYYTLVDEGGAKLRLFVDEEKRFVIHLSTLEAAADMMSYEELQAIVEEKVLPLLGARDVRPHSGWE
jgi:hypothetical protein